MLFEMQVHMPYAMCHAICHVGHVKTLTIQSLIALTRRPSMLSDVLGRTAHIAFLESDAFARLLAWGVVRR